MNAQIIEKIKGHILGNKEEAFSLYFLFCDYLNEKHGFVNKNFDDNPARRGKEWLDIHHILEYQLDDIANKTKTAREIERSVRYQSDDKIVVILKATEFRDNKKREEIRQLYSNKSQVTIYGLDYSTEELKPYNVKEQLVYANKIEHFLLHYLIDSIRGKAVFSGGPNFLWDNSVALDIYEFNRDYLKKIQSEKEKYYSIMSSEEVTQLYKKLIDWKDWEIQKCSRFWVSMKAIVHHLKRNNFSCLRDKDKFFRLLDIICYKLNDEDND